MTAIKVLTPLTGPSHLPVKKVCWVLWSYWGAAQHSQPGWQFGIFDICELQVVKPQCSGCHVGPEGFLSFVRHTWPAGHRLHCPASSARQETPRYSTISCYAQVSVRLNINTCNGNEVTNIYLVKTVGRPPRTDVHQGQCRTKTETDQHPGDLSAPGLSDQQEELERNIWLVVLPDVSH